MPGVRPTQQSVNLVTKQSAQSLKESDLRFSAYSLNAADLQLDSTSFVLDQSQFHFYSTAPETQISEPMPDHRSIVQNLETELSEAKLDKSRYNLFNPTPRNLLREFATDRPDTTESPFTVDAGHFQFEAELVNFSRRASDEDGNTTEDLLFTATNLKVGLLNNVDLQLVVQPYSRSRIKLRDSNRVEETAGFDALVARVKVNIYGNDAFEKPGATALAVMPFISIPTVQDGVGGNFVEGGLIRHLL
ncbi:transporter [Fortiea contorta]|uniref:transporter n=1 Tax=Fortiea contorta TaxID=1892405 RepID=UPI001375B24A|nr:transporter [Fortiea contorta]